MDYYVNWGLCNLPTFKLPGVAPIDEMLLLIYCHCQLLFVFWRNLRMVKI